MASLRDEEEVQVVGAASHPLRDAYHSLLEMRWATVLSALAGAFLLLNAAFAGVYLLVGGISGAQPSALLRLSASLLLGLELLACLLELRRRRPELLRSRGLELP